jgi:hypothetical protein
MGMAAPKGMAPAAPQAGLAAIAQPAQAPKGMSSGNMAQVMAMARKMSDGQLAEVLQGKSLDVPQYVAMTEAMGRKSLRTAMQGQQAMAQAQQPSVKQKLLMGDQPQMQGIQQGMPQMSQQPVMAAEGGLMYADGGLADLPAPNMESMDMASGGIVAFDQGGEVPRFNEGGNWFTDWRDSLYSPEEKRYEAMKRGRATDEPSDTLSQNQINAVLRGKTPGPAEVPMPPESMQKEIDDSKMRLFKQDMAAREEAANAKPVSAGPTKAEIDALNARPRVNVGGGAGKEKAGLGATDEFKSYMDNLKKERADSMAELKGLSAKQREAADRAKNQGGGEALMAIARGLVSKPGLAAGVGEGLPGVMAASAASRKEQNALNQSANDYDLNIAKAKEAAAKGDMEAALQYKKLAQDAQYQQGMLAYHNASLNKPDAGIAMLNALKDPSNMAIFKDMSAAKKGELYSIDKATDDFNKIAADKFSDPAKRLKALGITTPYQYQQYVLNQTGSGGGTDLQAQAIAELARRSKS